MNVKNKIPKSVKLKTYLVTILLISVIFAGVFNYALSNLYVGDVSEVWLQPPFHEASYVVGAYNSTFYYAQNGTTGEYEWLSTNAHTVTNNAIGEFTHTYKQKIAFIGSLTFTSPIQVQNYTVLDFSNAQLNLGASCNLIETVNDNNVHSVEIHGGVLHGWDYTGDAIHINTTSNLVPSWRNIIQDITIKYFNGDGVSLYGDGGRSIVSNSYIYNCTRGVYANSPDGKFTAVIVGDSGHEAWYVSGGSNVLLGCKGYGSGKDDITQGSGIVFYGRQMEVVGGVYQENYKYGAEIKSTSYAISLTGVTFSRNSLGASNTYDAVYVAGDNVTINGGRCENMEGKSKTQRHGIYVASTASQVRIHGVGEHELLGQLYHIEDGATDVYIDSQYESNAEVTVYQRGDYLYTMKANGAIVDVCDASSATATFEMVNASFTHLTSGRDYKETMRWDAVITVNNIIEFPPYLKWEITKKLNWTTGLSFNSGYMTNYASSDEFIEICGGGEIDFNSASQNENMSGIYLNSVDYFSCHDLTIHGGRRDGSQPVDYGHGIQVSGGDFGLVQNCFFIKTSVTYDCIQNSGNYWVISDNTMDGVAGGYSAFVQLTGDYNLVSDNYIELYDTQSRQSAIKIHSGDNNVISGNVIRMTGTDAYGGIDFIQNADYNLAEGNTFYDVERGFYLRVSGTLKGNVIRNNHIYLTTDHSVTEYGIDLSEGDDTAIIGNYFWGHSGSETAVRVQAGVTDTYICLNFFCTNIATAIDDSGTGTNATNNFYPDIP